MKELIEMTRTMWVILWAWIAFVAACGVVIWLSIPSSAHDAIPTVAMPQGWSYPFSCCSGYDCRKVSNTAVKETSSGYEIVITHELIPYNDSRIKNSPDGDFHWCSVAGSDTGRTICLFAPPRGM